MKNFTFVFVLFFSLLLNKSAFSSNLNISINENASFWVTLNGLQYNSNMGVVHISDIAPGNHFLEAFKSSLDLGGGLITTRIFSGYVGVMPGKNIHATIDRFGAFKVTSVENMYGQTFSDLGTPFYGSFCSNSYPATGDNFGYSNGNYCNNFPVSNNGYEYSTNPFGYSGHPSGYAHTGMHPQTFSMLTASMRNESFDDNRVKMASHAIAMNGVSCFQLKELMMLLTFDSNRLRLAKMAYPMVVDKGNIFIINDAFTFSSSADEFYRSIGW